MKLGRTLVSHYIERRGFASDVGRGRNGSYIQDINIPELNMPSTLYVSTCFTAQDSAIPTTHSCTWSILNNPPGRCMAQDRHSHTHQVGKTHVGNLVTTQKSKTKTETESNRTNNVERTIAVPRWKPRWVNANMSSPMPDKTAMTLVHNLSTQIIFSRTANVKRQSFIL